MVFQSHVRESITITDRRKVQDKPSLDEDWTLTEPTLNPEGRVETDNIFEKYKMKKTGINKQVDF
jgi:hypothetical protein